MTRSGVIVLVVCAACAAPATGELPPGGGGVPGDDAPGGTGGPVDPPPTPAEFDVALVPDGASGAQLVNFAIPLAQGALSDASAIAIRAGGAVLPAATRALAKYDDDSLRSVQVQVTVDVSAHTKLTVALGAAGQAAGTELAPVASTLAGTGANVHPRVWAVLPARVLVASGVAGPITARDDFADTALDAWSRVCDYERWGTDAFLVNANASRDVWLYDRVTAMVRGYITTGQLPPLRSAYREAALYRDGMTIANGVATAIAVPGASTDLKYYYAQGLALHYLFTGDDRFREAAEAVSAKVATMWNPKYDGGDRFWTERHAGFALLAHEWALRVTDDKAAEIAARAEAAVAAYLDEQARFPVGYTDTEARCFAHSAAAHGEDFGTFGCSPWMSAILADALDAHARRVGGERAAQVNASLGRLGRSLARDGRDGAGKPYYWMGVGSAADVPDEYEEHWGETAYVVALAWHVTGRSDGALRQAADQLVAGLRTRGAVGQVRSFNWQCRSAIMTPTFLR
ncbi:MAG: hypothetical protein KF773_27855 [Deltaproteobacteria bacterium]|nr:hypothetical protein [Deltaproteobacteria bacterium]MCW5801912.1 hypothetical protein [Deltaproteobacteria bacterium]